MSSNTFSTKASVRTKPGRIGTLMLAVSLGLLGLAAGCGGSGGSSFPINGNFDNSSLNGSYAFHLYGLDTTGNQYAEAGTFTADGNGNITGGNDDFNQLGNGFFHNSLTGRYTVGKDGNGTILFNINGDTSNTFQVAITMASKTKVYMTEADSFANATGEATQQNTSALSTPGGTFAFQMHDLASNSVSSIIGAMTSTNGNASGTLDELRNGALQSGVTVTTGFFNAPDSTGRGTFTFTDSLGITSGYIYYVIDSSTVEFLQSDTNNLGLGRMEKQSGGPYSLSGNYVFGSTGDTSTILGVRTVGGFTADGTSQITDGAYDSVQDGAQTVNQPFTGSFTQSNNGRVAVTLSPSGGSPISEVFWMVNSGRAFFLVNDPNKVEDGTIDAQQNGSFNNASMSGQYAFVNDGFATNLVPPFLTRVGTFIPDGNGNLNLNEVVNSFGVNVGASVQNTIVNGTYSVAAPGRATATLNGGQGNIDLVFYMVSPSQAYVLQNDAATEISGKMLLQTSP